jgi:beta-1,4-mannosyl-glycoprotein beta-1,4-N-acetylglucosaminyltransferase
MLEIRLMELRDVVDFFVLVESPITFTGREKRITYMEARNRFRFFWHQIIYVNVDTFPEAFESTPNAHWQRELYMRTVTFERGVNKLARVGDLIFHSDVDEIPRPWVMRALRSCNGYNAHKVRLGMQFSYYAYSFQHANEWTGAAMTEYAPVVGMDAAKLREAGGETLVVRKAGWHCSSCFPTFEQFRNKIRGFSHVEFGRNPHMYDREHIRTVVSKGLDLFDRSDQVYTFREVGPEDAPMFVLMHPYRFAYLLDRRGPAAGLENIWE